MLSRRKYLRTICIGLAGLTLARAARAADEIKPEAPQNPQFRRYGIDQDQIVIGTATGRYPVFVKIVSDRENADSAFKGKARIPPHEGALYVVSVVKPISLSNDGVPFGTDIMFVARDGRIIEIHPAVMANSAQVFVSNIPVKAALQVLAGTVMRLDIVPGDHVFHKLFGRTL